MTYELGYHGLAIVLALAVATVIAVFLIDFAIYCITRRVHERAKHEIETHMRKDG